MRTLYEVARMAEEVFNPQRGGGWRETILASLLIIGLFILWGLGRDVPTWVQGIATLISGFYFGRKTELYSPLKKS